MAMTDSIRINTNINVDRIDTYKVNGESIERLNKSIKRFSQVMMEAVGRDNFQTMKLMNENLQQSLLKLSSVFGRYDYEALLKGVRFTISEMVEKTSVKQIEAFQNIDFAKVFEDSFYREKYDEASKIAFEYAEDEMENEDDISQEELLEVFNEQMENQVGWQEKLYNKSEEFKRKYFVFYCILCFILSQILAYFMQLGIAYAFGSITSEPEKDSPVIYYFDQRTAVNIIGETENYYFITYIDSDGNEVTGYSDKETTEILPEEGNETEGAID